MPVTGRENLKRRTLVLAGGGMQRRIGKALFVGGQLLEDEARGSIMSGSAAGQSGGKHQHVRSRPGEPPMNEEGVLQANIETVQKSPTLVEVSSNAPHSRPLEDGTSKMAARPFMRPARDKTEKAIRELVAKAVNEEIKRNTK